MRIICWTFVIASFAFLTCTTAQSPDASPTITDDVGSVPVLSEKKDNDPSEISMLLNTDEQVVYDKLKKYLTGSHAVIIDDTKEQTTAQSLLNIFPNPVQADLNVEWNGHQNQNYQILNMSGQLVQFGKLSPGQNRFRIADLSAGLYIFKAESTMLRFVKQ